MDFSFSESRAGVRRRGARLARGQRAGGVAARSLLDARRRPDVARDRARLAAQALRRRLDRDLLAARARRPRRDGDRALAVRGGARPRRRALPARQRQRRHDRPGDAAPRHRSAADALPQAPALRRGLVVPGLLRARRRLRPRRPALPRRARTATRSSSTARRSGPATPRSPTGASCSAAPRWSSRSTRASACCWST